MATITQQMLCGLGYDNVSDLIVIKCKIGKFLEECSAAVF